MSRESEEGTYARLLMSPISLGALIFGKTLYDLALNVARTLVVFGLAYFAYGARPSTDFGTILAISLLIALLTMGFGFAISSLGIGMRAVIIIEFFLVLFLFAFSGFIIDRELLRGISSSISYVLPWAYGIEILKRTILVGQSLLTLASQLEFIIASIAVFYGHWLRFSQGVAGEACHMSRFARDTSAVTVKELKQLLRDPLSLALTILFPILLIQIFIVIVTAFSAPSYNIAVVVSDLDGSSTSKDLVDKLTSSHIIKVTQFLQTEEQALHAVESGSATGAVIIPKGFGDALLDSRPAFVILQTDNSKITSSALVQSAVASSTQELAGPS